MTKYEKALDSDQHALTLLKASESDAKLLAVLYQNMGALYNYMGQFQEAIEYHKIAIKKHAELKARKSQGHCFLNLGYAYSQLRELEKAGESFLHAAQAAKDCGDKKSEWQSLEAMGSVAYNQGDLRKAQEYYKQSLATVGVSEDTADKDVQDRILTKLTQIIHSQAQKSLVSVRQRTLAASKTPTEETAVKQTTSDYTSLEEQPASMRPSDIRPSDILEGKDQKVIKVKRGSKIKHIKIRRSGTLRQFKKFALGLDVSRPSTAEQRMLPSKDAVSILSAETISEHDMDEMESTGSDDDSDTENQNRQAKQNVQSPDGIEADEASENDESGDDERKVHAEMQKYASEEMPGTSGFVRQIFSADVHAKAQDDASDSEDGDNSDETSSDDSDDDDDDGKSEPQKKALAPPVPPMSPPVTAEPANVRTYEKPTQREPLYETIDHLRKSRGTSGGERRVSDGDGLNFFHSDEWGDKQKKNSKGGKAARIFVGEHLS
ncbi:tetratricopeptide repeat protein 24-like [Plakobranchus ocellatus]|uniref:Tetratricopeptide repeat protein 24-like n=1 Tax=Plakobranchus ocellatus TaxID=259542 RepID=A0AAV4CWE4_9GAST|nr:tetratricopeptide repeat protein 24-like [Plakobranchus ocellatus]